MIHDPFQPAIRTGFIPSETIEHHPQMAEEHQKVVEEHRKMVAEQYSPIFHSNSQFENSPDFANG